MTTTDPGTEPSLLSRFAVLVRRRWRGWLRGLHRDAGYLAIGLTFIYAISGLALNHQGDFDTDYVNVERTHQLDRPLPAKDAKAAAEIVLSELDISHRLRPDDYYMPTDDQLEIDLGGNHFLRVDVSKGLVFEEDQKPRFFLRMANWFHRARGKTAWRYFADGYAIFLLFLATSGIFMLRGRKGFFGRGAIIMAAGIAIPVLYLHFSGGPGG